MLNQPNGEESKVAYIREYLKRFSSGEGEGRASLAGTLSGRVYGTRSDGSESLLLIAPFVNSKENFNVCGISLALTLLNSFNQKKFWSRDVTFVLPGVGAPSYSHVYSSLQQWVEQTVGWEAKHSLESGQYQGGIILEVEGDLSCKLENEGRLIFEGSQGLLPNLDLINTIALLHKHRGGNVLIDQGKLINYLTKIFPNEYIHKILLLFGATFRPAIPRQLSLNTPLLASRIDSVTIRYVSNADLEEDETFAILQQASLLYRSLNNILEHLHQSFFAYLLPNTEEFYSISTYLAAAIFPIAGLISFYILSEEPHVILWIISFIVTIVFLLLQIACSVLLHRYRYFDLFPSIIIVILAIMSRRSGICIDFRPVCCLFASFILLSVVLLNFSQACLVGILFSPFLLFSLHPIACILSPLPLSWILSISVDEWSIPTIFVCMQPLFMLSILSSSRK